PYAGRARASLPSPPEPSPVPAPPPASPPPVPPEPVPSVATWPPGAADGGACGSLGVGAARAGAATPCDADRGASARRLATASELGAATGGGLRSTTLGTGGGGGDGFGAGSGSAAEARTSGPIGGEGGPGSGPPPPPPGRDTRLTAISFASGGSVRPV